jgi:hypothetical protein
MAFRRTVLAVVAPPADELTARMVGIGMNFASEPRVDADIESTLLHASEAAYPRLLATPDAPFGDAALPIAAGGATIDLDASIT